MQHTITKGLYFTSLDTNFNPCSKQSAFYQLEEYVTDAGNVFAISFFTGKLSYSVGQKVDVVPNIELNKNLVLEKVIKNAYLNAYTKNRIL